MSYNKLRDLPPQLGQLLELRELNVSCNELTDLSLNIFGRLCRLQHLAAEGNPLGPSVPASALQLHQNVKILMDDAAASKLEQLEYYKEVFSKKPDWQRAGREEALEA